MALHFIKVSCSVYAIYSIIIQYLDLLFNLIFLNINYLKYQIILYHDPKKDFLNSIINISLIYQMLNIQN